MILHNAKGFVRLERRHDYDPWTAIVEVDDEVTTFVLPADYKPEQDRGQFAVAMALSWRDG